MVINKATISTAIAKETIPTVIFICLKAEQNK